MAFLPLFSAYFSVLFVCFFFHFHFHSIILAISQHVSQSFFVCLQIWQNPPPPLPLLLPLSLAPSLSLSLSSHFSESSPAARVIYHATRTHTFAHMLLPGHCSPHRCSPSLSTGLVWIPGHLLSKLNISQHLHTHTHTHTHAHMWTHTRASAGLFLSSQRCTHLL